MIEDCVLPSHHCSELRIPRGNTGPDFASDGGAHLVNKIVLETAADRRPEPALQVALAEPILVPWVWIEMLHPVIREVVQPRVDPALLKHLQPDELEI